MPEWIDKEDGSPVNLRNIQQQKMWKRKAAIKSSHLWKKNHQKGRPIAFDMIA